MHVSTLWIIIYDSSGYITAWYKHNIGLIVTNLTVSTSLIQGTDKSVQDGENLLHLVF